MDPLNDLSLQTFLDRLASSEPMPGGGAVVALTGAQAVALLRMAVAITDKGMPSKSTALDQRLAKAQSRLLELATEDGRAFISVMNAYKLPTGADAERKTRATAIQEALRGAASVPLQVMRELADLDPLFEGVVNIAKPSMASDVAIAIRLQDTALKASRENIRINLKYLKDEAFQREIERETETLLDGRRQRRKQLLKKLRAHY